MKSVTYLTAINGAAEPDIFIEVPANPSPPLVPDALYIADCTGCDISEVFDALRVFYHFRIAEGPHAGSALFRAYPVGGRSIPGKGPRPHLTRNSDLAKMLRRVLRLENARTHRIGLRALVGQRCEIRTRTITKDRKKKEREPYSVVEDIVSVSGISDEGLGLRV